MRLKPVADGDGPRHETLLCPVADDGQAVVHQRAHEVKCHLLHRLRRPVGLLPEYAVVYRPQAEEAKLRPK